MEDEDKSATGGWQRRSQSGGETRPFMKRDRKLRQGKHQKEVISKDTRTVTSNEDLNGGAWKVKVYGIVFALSIVVIATTTMAAIETMTMAMITKAFRQEISVSVSTLFICSTLLTITVVVCLAVIGWSKTNLHILFALSIVVIATATTTMITEAFGKEIPVSVDTLFICSTLLTITVVVCLAVIYWSQTNLHILFALSIVVIATTTMAAIETMTMAMITKAFRQEISVSVSTLFICSTLLTITVVVCFAVICRSQTHLRTSVRESSAGLRAKSRGFSVLNPTKTVVGTTSTTPRYSPEKLTDLQMQEKQFYGNVDLSASAGAYKLDEEDELDLSKLYISDCFRVTPDGATVRLGGCRMTFPPGALQEQAEVAISLDYDMSRGVDGYTGIFPIISCELPGLEMLFPVKVEVTTWIDLEPLPEKCVDLFWMGNDGSWSKQAMPLSITGRKIQFETKHFSKYWLSISNWVDYYINSCLWIANYIYHDDIGNFTLLFCLDDEAIMIECIDYFEGGDCVRTFQHPMISRYPAKKAITCKLEVTEGGFNTSPEEGYVLTFDLYFKHKEKIITLQMASATPILELKYTVTSKDEPDKNIEENRKRLKWPITLPEATDYPSDVKHSSKQCYEAHLNNEGFYQISKGKLKGKVLVINNLFQNTDGERTGSEIDLAAMRNMWSERNIGCIVETAKDLSVSCLGETITSFRDSLIDGNSANVSMCAVIIMSHGNQCDGEDVVVCADRNPFPTRKILKMFKNQRQIRQIPKLFVMQCCRGGDEETDAPSLPENSIIIYACRKGKMSYRSRKRGSELIRRMTEVFVDRCQYTDVHEMLKKVRDRVLEERARRGRKKQICQIRQNLWKKFFLYPGWPKSKIE